MYIAYVEHYTSSPPEYNLWLENELIRNWFHEVNECTTYVYSLYILATCQKVACRSHCLVSITTNMA